MIFNRSTGQPGPMVAPVFTFKKLSDPTADASYLYAEATDPVTGHVHFDLALLESGTLTFTRVPARCRVFLQGGGDSGTNGSSSAAGTGGHGGRRLEQAVRIVPGVAYTVTVGAGEIPGTASAEDSAAFGLSSASGSRVAYGGGTAENSASRGQDGAVAFDGTSLIASLAGVKFGPGGGKGGIRNSYSSQSAAGNGGDDGGGKGGKGWEESDYRATEAGAANRGAGSGGGRGDKLGMATGPRARGGSGIILLRDDREEAAS